MRFKVVRSQSPTRCIVAVFGAGMLLAACSQGAEESQVASPTSTPTDATSSAGLTAEQRQVAAGLSNYDRTLDVMSGGGAFDLKKIRAVAAPPLSEELANSMQALKTFNHRTVGASKRNVVKITIDGQRATVLQCTDSAGSKVVSVGPHPTLISRDDSRGMLKIAMVKSASVWRVSKTEDDGTC
jgi:hypothetical protein